MQSPDTRAAVGELAADLGWLEDHCRAQPGLADHAGSLRLASALTRNVLGPFLEDQPARPLHVAVVGGAGAGKSTVVNFLCGSVVAEANPQAGFTRHPTAFLPASGAALPSTVGFLGPLRRVSESKPADLDEDVYQVRRLQPGAGADALADFVVWDCPDMTTWASSGYVARLMEVAALADVVVYVASDERYNDEVPTQFLHLAVRAGKAVVCVLTKMREADAPAMVEHFRQEVLGRLPPLPGGAQPAVQVVPFPQMPPDVRNDPAGAGAKRRVQLLNQILVQCESVEASRARTVTNAARFLASAGVGLLDVARRDLAEFEAWKGAVQDGRLAFEDRYRNEYLSGEQFRRFDRYRERLVELVELPGAGRVWGNVMWVLRAPYRWGRDTLTRLIVRPEVFNLSEKTVLDAALLGWLDGLRAEALKRAASHPVWKAAARGFDGPLSAEARDRFHHAFRTFELKETDDLETTGRQLVAHLEGNPALLYGLRGGKLAADAAVVGAAVWFTWPPGWVLLLLVPLGVSATHQAAELAARGAAEAARLKVRNHRESLMTETLTAPLAVWLADWPATGGTAFEKLQQVLGRVPQLIRLLEAQVSAKLK
ncbi:GTPase domain-containing protein [Urbifossiella limnaea]|uniref:GTP-binding protein Der n=1 Tax=Urbifossiella limnaea TaxID=2528023 RepID=A0A517XRJ0_9BACT|nr:GTPase domain-containing protein [Urbifossiella limnaea]QDU20119.1 GTP-binding protein Der [Urbifossiella limnaea]